MGSRGKTSAAELAVISNDGVAVIRRPDAPGRLSEDASSIWVDAVNSYAADHFTPDTIPMLEGYCNHAVNAQRLAVMIEDRWRGESLDLDALDQLARMHERECRSLSSLATRLRMTPQSKYDPKKKNTVNANRARDWK